MYCHFRFLPTRPSLTATVQRNGIVRIHKTRENANGTFSIGKTWGIDQLSKLEETDTLGFVITIQKPYYWMTETSKEKYAFIMALVQVYRKFTGGKTPEIAGFESIFRQSASQTSRQQSPPANPYATPPQAKPTNPYVNAAPTSSNPYAAQPPQPATSPYTPYPSNPYSTAAPPDPYSTVAPLKPQRRGSEDQIRRPPVADRIPSREGSRLSPERPRSREKSNRDINGTISPLPPIVPLNLTRQTSSPSPFRAASSETSSTRSATPASQLSKRQDEDNVSITSIGSRSARTGGPRPMASAPMLKSSPIPSQRSLAESPLPGARPGATRP